ncbi:rhodanese-like domain-containing protein [Shimazuella kribbensis]|uniref:rhodanese-like domain-containing protein n=1 Tax=Shimazuella kribbensis TaxID=139808 RepID=UPI00048D0D7C|nr:rhodanese-like domain-containing protein [Shimazuella kribbensis]
MSTITPVEVEQRLQSGERLNIIDVREIDEIAEGKIKQARSIPLGTLENRLQDLNREQEYIMVCRSGGRSERACKVMQKNGFKVTNMVGGMLQWNGKISK